MYCIKLAIIGHSGKCMTVIVLEFESARYSCSLVSDSLQPMDYYSPPGFSVHGILRQEYCSGYPLLQGIFPVYRQNAGLPHCRQILNHLSHQASEVQFTRYIYIHVSDASILLRQQSLRLIRTETHLEYVI